ncbi:MAG: type II toxin-antitoxin system VapC family toxin [Acidimicrobiia bacterium]
MALIHLDAGAIIGFLDQTDAHHAATRAALRNALHDGDRLAIAASALAESLVGPARRGTAAVQTVRLAERFPITVVELDADIAVSAAELRAAHRALRLPDSFVIAIARHASAEILVTTDRKWPTPKALGLAGSIKRL